MLRLNNQPDRSRNTGTTGQQAEGRAKWRRYQYRFILVECEDAPARKIARRSVITVVIEVKRADGSKIANKQKSLFERLQSA